VEGHQNGSVWPAAQRTDNWPARPSIWSGCDGPGPALTYWGSGMGREAGLILTDPAVWTSEACSTLAAVPVIPVHTGPAVVAAERKKEAMGRQFFNLDLFYRLTSIDTHFASTHFWAGMFSSLDCNDLSKGN